MKIFNLPKETNFGKVVPKNAFDNYTNTKQKKEISDYIKRISWINKLSPETTNLPTKEIKEIQIFLIELKAKNELKNILNIIDKSIPYHIIFVLSINEEIRISTSAKHDHITKADESVIDVTFSTKWIEKDKLNIDVQLQESLDNAYINFCNQINKRLVQKGSYKEFVKTEIEIKNINTKIKNIEMKIKKEKQFKNKLEQNLELGKWNKKLKTILKHK